MYERVLVGVPSTPSSGISGCVQAENPVRSLDSVADTVGAIIEIANIAHARALRIADSVVGCGPENNDGVQPQPGGLLGVLHALHYRLNSLSAELERAEKGLGL